MDDKALVGNSRDVKIVGGDLLGIKAASLKVKRSAGIKNVGM